MSVIRTIVGTIATKGAGFVLTLVVGVTVFRTIGATGKGEVDALVAWATLMLLAYPSVEEPQLYLIGRQDRPPRTFLANGVMAALLFGLLAIGVFEAIVAFRPGWLEYRDRATDSWRMLNVGHLRLLVLLSPMVILQKVLGGLLQGLRDMRAVNICFLIQNGVLLTGVLVLVLVLGWGVEGAVVSHALSMGTGGFCALLFCLFHPKIREGALRVDFRFLARLIVGGLRIHGGVVAAWLILMSDQLLVMRFWGAKETALYALAVGLTGHLRRLIVQPVKEVLGSRLPEMVGDLPRMSEAISRTCRHTILLTVIPGLALAALGLPILWVLYGDEALAAYGPLLMLVPGSLFWAAAVIVSYWFIGLDRLLTLTFIGLFIAGSNVVLNFLVVPTYGGLGAAATSTFCYGLHLCLFVGYVRIRDGISPARFLLPRRADLSVYGDAWRKIRALLTGAR